MYLEYLKIKDGIILEFFSSRSLFSNILSTGNFKVVVVVVGLFHTYLKYKYFYSDKCIEMVMIMIITTLSSNLEFDFKMHVIQFFRSHEIYSTVIIMNNKC